eukprot:368051-Rhodomonas_salina.1
MAVRDYKVLVSLCAYAENSTKSCTACQTGTMAVCMLQYGTYAHGGMTVCIWCYAGQYRARSTSRGARKGSTAPLLSSYAAAMQCPVLTYALCCTILRFSYAMS